MLLADYEIQALAEILADPELYASLLFVDEDSDYSRENSRHLEKYPAMHPEREGRLSVLAVLNGRLRVVIDGPGPDAKDPNTCPDCQGSGRWKFHGDEPCEYEEDVWHCEDGQLVQGEGDGS